ncbi:2-hydroxyacid dehydrogenase [Thermodesulfobacteriota bacterium]
MKIVFCNHLNRFWVESVEQLREEFPDAELISDRDNLEQEMKHAHALVANGLSEEQVQACRNLEIIFVPHVGVNTLPLDQITSQGIRISNVHGNSRYVAERAMAMTLSFYGRVLECHNDLKVSKWHGFWVGKGVRDSWDSIQGKTCAVIGVGEIGKYLARYLKAFDCRVIGFKRRPVNKIPEGFDDITLDLQQAIKEAELVFVVLPLTEGTRGLFSHELLTGMKGKFLVNMGRGEVVSEKGLYHALKEGILLGAAIDVWYNYPKGGDEITDPSQYPIQELPNVILSPHLAGFTPQAARLNIKQTIENVRSFLKTGRPLFEVDLDQMY